jgi:fused signal recognition particle receptor
MKEKAPSWTQIFSKGNLGAFTRLLEGLLSSDTDAFNWEEAESLLLQADMGINTTESVLKALQVAVTERRIKTSEDIKKTLGEILRSRLSAPPLLDLQTGPTVILIVGVNGAGKTTTVAKLGHYYLRNGKRSLIVAADTFRAAATEQLQVWAERAGLSIVKNQINSDPGAVVYDGIKSAISSGADIVLVDTAGRMNTKVNLLEELKKIKRVAGKALPGAPHATWLVLDATTGQNALSQAKSFINSIGITGIIMTKLDSSSRGGMIFALQEQLGLPVVFIGTGERLSDLKLFDPDEFVHGILLDK